MATRLDKSKMACNKPRRSPMKNKKKVVKACSNGKEKIIHYGDSRYPHNYSKEARKNFKARHGKNIKKGKMSAAYWANKDLWGGKGGSVKSPSSATKGGTYGTRKKAKKVANAMRK
jgi:hypothetical protein